MRSAIVFAAGPMSPEALGHLRQRVLGRSIDGRSVDVVVAADGGLDLALGLGVEPDLVIGDMDSVSSGSLTLADREGIEIREFPTAKDESDYELAIAAAITAGADHVTVVGSDAGRIDHLYATLLTLCSPRFSGVRLDALLGGNYLAVLNRGTDARPSAPTSAEIRGEPGAQVSLFAVRGPVRGITTTGLRWGMSADSLEVGTSRGVSNELTGTTASVQIDSGCLAIVVPVDEPQKGIDR